MVDLDKIKDLWQLPVKFIKANEGNHMITRGQKEQARDAVVEVERLIPKSPSDEQLIHEVYAKGILHKFVKEKCNVLRLVELQDGASPHGILYQWQIRQRNLLSITVAQL